MILSKLAVEKSNV